MAYKGHGPVPGSITAAREIGQGLGHVLWVYFFSWGVRKGMVFLKEVKVLLPRKGDIAAERKQNNTYPLHQYLNI